VVAEVVDIVVDYVHGHIVVVDVLATLFL